MLTLYQYGKSIVTTYSSEQGFLRANLPFLYSSGLRTSLLNFDISYLHLKQLREDPLDLNKFEGGPN